MCALIAVDQRHGVVVRGYLGSIKVNFSCSVEVCCDKNYDVSLIRILPPASQVLQVPSSSFEPLFGGKSKCLKDACLTTRGCRPGGRGAAVCDTRSL